MGCFDTDFKRGQTVPFEPFTPPMIMGGKRRRGSGYGRTAQREQDLGELKLSQGGGVLGNPYASLDKRRLFG